MHMLKKAFLFFAAFTREERAILTQINDDPALSMMRDTLIRPLAVEMMQNDETRRYYLVRPGVTMGIILDGQKILLDLQQGEPHPRRDGIVMHMSHDMIGIPGMSKGRFAELPDASRICSVFGACLEGLSRIVSTFGMRETPFSVNEEGHDTGIIPVGLEAGMLARQPHVMALISVLRRKAENGGTFEISTSLDNPNMRGRCIGFFFADREEDGHISIDMDFEVGGDVSHMQWNSRTMNLSYSFSAGKQPKLQSVLAICMAALPDIDRAEEMDMNTIDLSALFVGKPLKTISK